MPTKAAATNGEGPRSVQLFSPDSLADFLGVPVGTVYRWNYTGDGPRPIRVGRHVRYRPEDVDSWLEARAKVP